MTEETYRAAFIRYGRQEPYIEHDIRLFLHDPKRITKVSEILSDDKRAADYIRRLQEKIDLLQYHRQKLAARYGELETMGYTRELTLIRENRSYSGIRYYVTIHRIMDDGTVIDELLETYPGKERHKAIARYEELKKKNPGIKAEKNIEKSKWEK